jgi:hypothetical protein
MAGLQFVLEDKARTEQKYKKQIKILQVSWYLNKTERYQMIVDYRPSISHEEFKKIQNVQSDVVRTQHAREKKLLHFLAKVDKKFLYSMNAETSSFAPFL